MQPINWRTFAVMTLFALWTLALAVGPIVWIARVQIAGLREWLVASAAAGTTSGAALVVGPWALLSVYGRLPVAAAMTVAVAFAGYRASRAAPSTIPAVSRRRLALRLCTVALFGLLLIDGCAGRVPPEGTRDLRFPLEEGAYAVLQGGNSLATNPFHHWFPFDRYGMDLVKLNAFGNRAQGIAPAEATGYVSYGVAVFSPCTGMAEEVVDEVPDNAPGETDPQHLSGNHVLLRCGGVKVLLAHLRRASVAVAPGEQVRAGQPVGRIGNSGNTSEPHLHVSAVAADFPGPWRQAQGVPITFDGRFLSLNDVVRSGSREAGERRRQ